LYDVRTDPGEQNNLAAREPQRVAQMREQIRSLLIEAPLPPGEDVGGPSLDEADLERLASLGYAGGLSDEGAEPAELVAFEPSGEDPANHVAMIEKYVRAHRLMAEREFAAAEPLLREVVLAMPHGNEPLRELQRALRRLNRPDEIVDVCHEILETRPDATAARMVYGQMLLQRGERDAAIAQFEAVVERDPAHVEAHRTLADVLLGLGRLEEARSAYETALELAPREPRILHGLARVFLQEARYADAAALLRRALEINPNSSMMRRDLEAALEKVNP
jgi:tetratricopeptide (TPR) repeat protein